jgi:hypothetical protein
VACHWAANPFLLCRWTILFLFLFLFLLFSFLSFPLALVLGLQVYIQAMR